MGLLRAARGGVIEDLAVEWGSGANGEENMETDDEFEFVSNPIATPAVTKLPALNLFDEESTGETPELGPTRIAVNLPPPPVIQQAPKSDKLPIPLYPGFRCSIFAIIKQGINSGPHPPHVKITGNVLGRDVTLQIPVNPISINNTIEEAGVNKMLHTLAAKAFIQTFEDMPSTPETKAQIERLGKRYSLASSVTSFLAIDEDDRTEKEVDIVPEMTQKPIPPPSKKTAKKGAPSYAPMAASIAPPLSRYKSLGSSPPVPVASVFSFNPPSPMVPHIQYQQAQHYQRPSQLAVQPTGFAPGAMPSYTSAISQHAVVDRNLMQAYSAELSASASAPLPDDDDDDADYMLEEEADEDGDMGYDVSEDELESFVPPPPLAAPSTILSAAPKPLGVSLSLSVESLARAQKFDGSFPTDPQHISLITSGGTLSLPSTLNDLDGDEGTKEAIWVTLLTIACMEKRLASEKDVWEFLADKARDYVFVTLQTLCKDSARAEVLTKELMAAASTAV
jgi:hypothetical protein